MDFSDKKKSLPQGNLSCVYSIHPKIHKSWPWNYTVGFCLGGVQFCDIDADILGVKVQYFMPLDPSSSQYKYAELHETEC